MPIRIPLKIDGRIEQLKNFRRPPPRHRRTVRPTKPLLSTASLPRVVYSMLSVPAYPFRGYAQFPSQYSHDARTANSREQRKRFENIYTRRRNPFDGGLPNDNGFNIFSRGKASRELFLTRIINMGTNNFQQLVWTSFVVTFVNC